jgi:hypothetical protein
MSYSLHLASLYLWSVTLHVVQTGSWVQRWPTDCQRSSTSVTWPPSITTLCNPFSIKCNETYPGLMRFHKKTFQLMQAAKSQGNKTWFPRTETNPMGKSVSWEANNHSASQEITRLLCNPKVHYCVHKSSPLVPIPSHMNPAHNFPLCFPKIHRINILPSTPRSSEWFFLSGCIQLYREITCGSMITYSLLTSVNKNISTNTINKEYSHNFYDFNA